MTLYERYAPPLGAMQLIAFIASFIVLPYFYAPVGLQFAILTLAFIFGVQPHIEKLSEDGHRIPWAIGEAKVFGFVLWKRKDFSIRVHISNKKRSDSIATVAILIFAFLIVPLIMYVMYKSAGMFIERIDARSAEITASITQSLNWARAIAPEYVPEGDSAAVFGGVFADIIGDAKHLVTETLKEAAAVIGHLFKLWFEIIISMIVVGVLIKNWAKEKESIQWRISTGIQACMPGASGKQLTTRVFEFVGHYRDMLSTVLVGYIEVGIALSIYYFLMLTILPFNFGIGFILLISVLFGFITAVWKIGGIATKIISPFLILLYFQDGFGYFGYEFFSINLGVDLLLKAFVMFAIAFFGGYLEAYEYTPEKVGEKLQMTKMEMVMTILVWAIGAGAMGMVWGVLLMLLVPTFTRMQKDSEAAAKKKAAAKAKKTS
jgi:hypothetical protein